MLFAIPFYPAPLHPLPTPLTAYPMPIAGRENFSCENPLRLQLLRFPFRAFHVDSVALLELLLPPASPALLLLATTFGSAQLTPQRNPCEIFKPEHARLMQQPISS